MVLITQIRAPENGLLYTANDIKLKLGEKIIGTGTVYISQDALSWQPTELPEGISILWKQVSVHGISMQPSKCIYIMLDHKVEWDGVYDGKATTPPPANGHNGAAIEEPMEQQAAELNNDVDEGNETDEDDDDNEADGAVGGICLDDEGEMTECWLIPQDVHSVDTMFRAMTDCQALHPDSADSISDDSDGFMDDAGANDFVIGDGVLLGQGGEDNDGNGHAAAEGGLQNLSLNDDERFEDADE